jgi:hypothetical protein
MKLSLHIALKSMGGHSTLDKNIKCKGAKNQNDTSKSVLRCAFFFSFIFYTYSLPAVRGSSLLDRHAL